MGKKTGRLKDWHLIFDQESNRKVPIRSTRKFATNRIKL